MLYIYGPLSKDVTTVIFDLDGVMVPPMRFATYLEKNYAITRTVTSSFFVGEFNQCLLGNADLLQVLPPYLAEWGWKKSVREFVEVWLEEESCIDGRMVELVGAVRDAAFRCCLATNQEKQRAIYVRKHMKFESMFDNLFISCELGAMKPEPRFFELVQKQLMIKPQRILFIDDQEHYLKAAEEAGWNTRLFTSYENLFDDTSDVYFSHTRIV